MAKTPTTRPPSYRAGRRPQRGRRVPRSIHDRLNLAADQLEEASRLLDEAGHLPSEKKDAYLDSATLVRAVAAPGGWMRLRGTSSKPTINMTLSVDKALKDALVAASEEFLTPLSRVVDEGFQAVLDGTWTPPRRTRDLTKDRALAGTDSPARSVLNVRVNEELAKRVQQLAPSLQKELGYRVNRSTIAVGYLAWDLGVEQPELDKLILNLPTRLVSYLEERLAAEGLTFKSVLEDGIRELLDGLWTPSIPEWHANVSERPRSASGTWGSADEQGEPVSRSRFTILVDEGLLSGLRARVAQLTEESGYPFHQGTISRQILIKRLGEPEL